jgi:hypothetical protein
MAATTSCFSFNPHKSYVVLMVYITMAAMFLLSNHAVADLVLSDHIMAWTVEAAKLSMLAYDETEPDDTVTHDYSGTKQTNANKQRRLFTRSASMCNRSILL